MSPEAALIELLGRIGSRDGAAVTVNTEELNQWPAEAISALKLQGLLRKARPDLSVICPGCEQECSMPVHTPPRTIGPAMSFVVCDKRSDINRVPVPAARLALWRCDAQAVCGFIAASLGLQPTTARISEDSLLPVGIVRGEKRTHTLFMRVQSPLSLVVGTYAVPLADAIGFENGGFTLDRPVIDQMVDAFTTTDTRYRPSTAKRDARKMDTQAMYESWQKAYRVLIKKSPGKSDVWYSQQIAKADKVHVRDPSTIKKHMKS
jgi:hypothetical protein